MMLTAELDALAEEIEQSDGIALMLTGGAVQLGIRRTAIVVAALRDRRKYSLLESQFANCHKEIQRLRDALLATALPGDSQHHSQGE
jgi:hypothetical protein